MEDLDSGENWNRKKEKRIMVWQDDFTVQWQHVQTTSEYKTTTILTASTAFWITVENLLSIF